MTQERIFKRHDPFIESTDHSTGMQFVPSSSAPGLILVTLIPSLYLEAKVMLALQLSCSGQGSLLLSKTSKSTAHLCPLHTRACSKANHNIQCRFLQEDPSRDGTELGECF